MEHTSPEYNTFKNLLNECKYLADELDITLTEVIQLRQLLSLHSIIQIWIEQIEGQQPNTK